MRAVIFSEGALAPTGRLFADAVAALARKLGRVKPLDPASLPADRPAMLAALREWAGDEATTWEHELGRYVDEHAPLYLRPDPALNAAVRRLARDGIRLGAWSPGPREAAESVVGFLGLSRRLEALRIDPAPDAPTMLARELAAADRPADVLVVADEASPLRAARAAGMSTAAALWHGADAAALRDVLPTYLATAPGDLVALALEGRTPVTR